MRTQCFLLVRRLSTLSPFFSRPNARRLPGLVLGGVVDHRQANATLRSIAHEPLEGLLEQSDMIGAAASGIDVRTWRHRDQSNYTIE